MATRTSRKQVDLAFVRVSVNVNALVLQYVSSVKHLELCGDAHAQYHSRDFKIAAYRDAAAKLRARMAP